MSKINPKAKKRPKQSKSIKKYKKVDPKEQELAVRSALKKFGYL